MVSKFGTETFNTNYFIRRRIMDTITSTVQDFIFVSEMNVDAYSNTQYFHFEENKIYLYFINKYQYKFCMSA